MTKPIVVTGATGNVGCAVVRALSARAMPIRAGVRNVASARRVLGDTPMVAFDFDKQDTFDAALDGAGGLFLLRPPAVSNVGPTLNALVDRAERAGVDHVIFLSVEGADRTSWVPHHAIEKHLFRSTVPWTIVRPGFFSQNLGDAYRDDIRARSEIRVPAGRGRVAFVDVRDVGEVAAQAFFDPNAHGKAWTLTGPEAVSFNEVAQALTDALGRPVRYVPSSVPGYALHLRRSRLPWMQIAVQTVLHVGLRMGSAEKVDPTLERLLGKRPRTIRDYIRDHLELWTPPKSSPA